jgi:acylphosphatase
MSEARSILVHISGRVQGVGYRDWTQREADRLGLSGWVRNLSNGNVEAVFSGPAEAVERMLTLARSGPRSASVADVKVAGEAAPAGGPFRVRYDR